MTSTIASIDVAAERKAVLTELVSWMDTPFHHGARVKGAGVDCAQLAIAAYLAAGLIPEIEVGYYAPDWFLHSGRECILELLQTFMVPTASIQSADIVAFRYGRAAVGHLAIVTIWPTVIHAYRGRHVAFDRGDLEGSMGGRFAGGWTLKRWADA